MVSGRILITGGTGSLGQAITCRARTWGAQVVVYSRDEAKQAAMRAEYPEATYVLGDVRDAATLEVAARGCDVIIHAAAQKRVPEAERQPITCAQANVEGSARVVEVARRLGTPQVLAISTDKACAPINAYGMTKALMERMWQAEALERPTGPAFHLVRYGNVLGSTGSVVPAFRAQAEQGRLHLTEPRMTRFWLTLDDAVDLIMWTLTNARSGTIVVPRSRAASMAAMAEAVAPGVPIDVIGNRGGEKRHESLVNPHEVGWASRAGADVFLIAPMAGEPGELADRQAAYTSASAQQLSVPELRALIDGTRLRTLSLG